MNGAIIGDIVGSVYEFHTIKQKEFKFFKDKCFFTDDTVMTCAIALACIEYNSNRDIEMFKKNVSKMMRILGKKYPEAGYGYSFYEWIFDDNKTSYNSFGNGGAMRTSPVAYVANSLEECELLAEAQASVTHDHPEGIKGAKAISAAIYMSKENYSKEEIRKYIEDNYYKIDFTIPQIRRKYQYDITAQGSVPQAIEAFLEGENFEDCIRNAICIGGDADTLAAMTGSIAEAFYGIPKEYQERMSVYLTEELNHISEEFNRKLINTKLKEDNFMPTIEINPLVKEIISKINEQGYQAYLVGGAVRDAILNKENKDFDLCTNMPLPKIKELFPSFVIMKPNNHRNTGVMRINGEEIEISEFRGKDIIEDLSNRDFTMNAMAMDKDGNIIDPFNGIESLTKKEISLIKKDGEAFEIDPLRIIRAIRMASKMNFELDSNCKEQTIAKKELLSNVPVERIYKELIQIMVTKNPAKYIRENKEVFFQIIPELKIMDGFEQNNSYHIYDVFEHTMAVLENTSNNIYLRLAALFHDIGKPQTYQQDEKGVGHFYGHPIISSKIFELVATRLKMDNRSKKEIKKLIEFHDYNFGKKKNSMYKFFENYGTTGVDLLFELKSADIKGQNPIYADRLQELEEIKGCYLELLATNPCLSIRNLMINGNILKKYGIEGKQIGKILEEVLNQVKYQGLSNTKEELLAYVERKYK